MTNKVHNKGWASVKIYIAAITNPDGEVTTKFFPTRYDAEREYSSSTGASPDKSIASIAIFQYPEEVASSPKRSFIQGMNTDPIDLYRDIVSRTKDNPDWNMISYWTPISGWLTKDERSLSRRTTLPPDGEHC
jgi:hypothetical protein